MSSEKLKPCHRCAGASQYHEEMALIMCGNCGFYIEQITTDLDEFIAYWNTRAESQEMKEAKAKIKELEKEKDELVEIANHIGNANHQYVYGLKALEDKLKGGEG